MNYIPYGVGYCLLFGLWVFGDTSGQIVAIVPTLLLFYNRFPEGTGKHNKFIICTTGFILIKLLPYIITGSDNRFYRRLFLYHHFRMNQFGYILVKIFIGGSYIPNNE